MRQISTRSEEFSHSSHLKGFFSLWVLWCIVKYKLGQNFFIYIYTLHLNGFSSVWLLWCYTSLVDKLALEVKLFSHFSHLKVSSWCESFGVFLNMNFDWTVSYIYHTWKVSPRCDVFGVQIYQKFSWTFSYTYRISKVFTRIDSLVHR